MARSASSSRRNWRMTWSEPSYPARPSSPRGRCPCQTQQPDSPHSHNWRGRCMPATPPEMAAVDFDPKKFMRAKIEALKPRKAVLIAKARSPDRSGIATGVAGSKIVDRGGSARRWPRWIEARSKRNKVAKSEWDSAWDTRRSPQTPQVIDFQIGARCRVRTYDPIRVKDVLYH